MAREPGDDSAVAGPASRHGAWRSLRAGVAVSLAALVGSAAWPRPAQANVAEVFGFGSRQAGLSGAVTARVDDFSAGYYNPAGLALSDARRLGVGMLAFDSHLEANGARVPIRDPFGVVLGASAPVPLGGPLAGRVHVGIGVFLLPRSLARVIAHRPEDAFYPYYDNRTQRAVVLPALAVRLTRRLALGLGLNTLGFLDGAMISAEGPTRATEPRADLELGTHVAAHVGASFELGSDHTLGLVYRQAFGAPYRVTTDNTVAGQQIDLDVRAQGLYTPHQFALGWAWRTRRVVASADVTWALWSRYPGPYVEVSGELPIVGPLAGELPDVPWQDTLGVRAGLEAPIDPGGLGPASLRAGYGFETSPVPSSQPGVTNLLDGPRHIVSAGVGVPLGRPGRRGSMRLDVHTQVQIVGARTLEKTVAAAGDDPASFDALVLVEDAANDPATAALQLSNPGYPSISSGGAVVSAGLTLEVTL